MGVENLLWVVSVFFEGPLSPTSIHGLHMVKPSSVIQPSFFGFLLVPNNPTSPTVISRQSECHAVTVCVGRHSIPQMLVVLD